MAYIILDELGAATFALLWQVRAEDPAGRKVKLWQTERLIQAVGDGHPGTMNETATILVPSLDPVDLQPIVDRLPVLDPASGGDRLMGAD